MISFGDVFNKIGPAVLGAAVTACGSFAVYIARRPTERRTADAARTSASAAEQSADAARINAEAAERTSWVEVSRLQQQQIEYWKHEHDVEVERRRRDSEEWQAKLERAIRQTNAAVTRLESVNPVSTAPETTPTTTSLDAKPSA